MYSPVIRLEEKAATSIRWELSDPNVRPCLHDSRIALLSRASPVELCFFLEDIAVQLAFLRSNRVAYCGGMCHNQELPFPRPSTGPPSPNSPKLLRRRRGNCRGNSGCWGSAGGTAAETALPLRSRETALFGSLCSSSPSTPPSTPSFLSNFSGSLRSNFWKFGLAGPVDGRGNGEPRGAFQTVHSQGGSSAAEGARWLLEKLCFQTFCPASVMTWVCCKPGSGF